MTCLEETIMNRRLINWLGLLGIGAFPPQYFGIFERFSTVAAVGYNAVLGVYLFNGFGEQR